MKRTPVEIERARRIRLAIWAYAYEYEAYSMVSDGEFDEECLKVDLSIDTGNPKMDRWFRENFDPSTGMWIRLHPELEAIKARYHFLRSLK